MTKKEKEILINFGNQVINEYKNDDLGVLLKNHNIEIIRTDNIAPNSFAVDNMVLIDNSFDAETSAKIIFHLFFKIVFQCSDSSANFLTDFIIPQINIHFDSVQLNQV